MKKNSQDSVRSPDDGYMKEAKTDIDVAVSTPSWQEA